MPFLLIDDGCVCGCEFNDQEAAYKTALEVSKGGTYKERVEYLSKIEIVECDLDSYLKLIPAVSLHSSRQIKHIIQNEFLSPSIHDEQS
jgi:hypothetical protein